MAARKSSSTAVQSVLSVQMGGREQVLDYIFDDEGRKCVSRPVVAAGRRRRGPSASVALLVLEGRAEATKSGASKKL